METIVFEIDGMHCDGCASVIRAMLEPAAGVRKASTSFPDKRARVEYDALAVSEAQLVALIEQGGYRVAGRSRA
ncbi:MAG TPA: heavy-metal-associated domain-containing protein [Burkholderiales bacterium]|nr:heavy-metal-associated domain-containing protein [Burkholderiales bacterium]